MQRTLLFPTTRRHTRYWRDWSSDVCSSDLTCPPTRCCGIRRGAGSPPFEGCGSPTPGVDRSLCPATGRRRCPTTKRSEERRAGKECRSRWSQYHYEKKDPDHGPTAYSFYTS